MIAEEFMKADEVIIHSLRCWVGEDGMRLDEASARRVAVLEQSGYVVDLESRRVFQPDDQWQPFVNWWMDWMWSEKRQRGYAKLASVMEAITRRSDPDTAERVDWCEMAKFYQQRYFQRIVTVAVVVMMMMGLGLIAQPARAAVEDVTLTYLGTEVIDENGVPTPNNTYAVDCDGEELIVEIEVTFVDGAVSFVSGEYCGAKIYIVGSIALVEVVGVMAAPPDVVRVVYLPLVVGR